VPRLARVAEGWAGGRTAVYRDGSGRESVVLALDWDDGPDAAQWAEAVTTYVNQAFGSDRPGVAATTACAAAVCWDVGARAVAFGRRGAQTALVFGPDVAAAAAAARQVVGLTLH
jgi:hypothetical protein